MSDVPRPDDWLVHQLPVGMLQRAADAPDEAPFIVRFLRIFQDIADTYMQQADSLEHVFDIAVAPDEMVKAMAEWLGVDYLDASLDEQEKRNVVRANSEALLWRGTERGLTTLLGTITGGEVVVTDTAGGVYREGEAPEPGWPHVVVELAATGWASERDIVELVRQELPAWVTFELHIAGRQVWPAGVDRDRVAVDGVTVDGGDDA